MSQTHISFDDELGLQVPATEDIRTAVADDWQKAFNRGEGSPLLDVEPTSPAGQLIDALTAEIEAKNSELLYLANQLNPKTAVDRFQDALGYIYFLTRKIAEATVVMCKVTGLNGTIIPYSAIVQSTEGYNLTCLSSVTIGSSGAATAYFQVSEPGPIEIAAHSVTKIVTVIPGWSSVDNDEPGATGRLKETRAEFEARRYASVAKNAHGSAISIYGTIADINGVIDCQVLENTGPNPKEMYGVNVDGHSVAVCVYGGEDDDIAEAIYTKKDAGCGTSGNTTIQHVAYDFANALYEYKIYRPETVSFNVQVAIPNASALNNNIKNAVKEAVVTDFLGKSEISGNSRVGLASTVYASRFYIAVMSTDGVSQISNIKIALGNTNYADSVVINADQEPVITEDNVTIVEA